MASQTKKMTYVRLGKSGLKISSIILGCMTYGSPKFQSWFLDEEEGLKHIKHAYDRGIQTFDTANVYSNGLSEVILGKAIKKYSLPRDEIVVMTKLCGTVGRTIEEGWLDLQSAEKKEEQRYTNQSGLSRKNIFGSVKRSLERLQLDYIDVLQCHRFDYNTPIEETMQALHDVVQAGYARYIGMSSCYAHQFYKMQTYAISHNLTPFISMQNFHTALYREEEREMLPTLKEFGVGSIPWSPLARGLLTHPTSVETARGQSDSFSRRVMDFEKEPALKAIIDAVENISKKRRVSMAQVALAWSLAQPGITAPIVGTTKLENLDDLVDGLGLKLTQEELDAISAPYVPRAIQGHF